MSLELTTSHDELREAFFALETRQDIANLLEVSEAQLIYHLYIERPREKYTSFAIPKKSGGTREILAPDSALKIIQRKLNQVLQAIYEPKPSVHGFVEGKSIVSNARVHARRRHVFNVDLKDFFPSINFGRVRGMFIAVPYNRNAIVATVLAQICCFNNQLPQGAPTSPTVSNMICAKMDTQLQQLAKRYKSTYTRYADDITFSTTKYQFPSSIAKISDTAEQIEIGNELAAIISANGFEINERKVRLLGRGTRQEVTGLVTNLFPNVQRRYIREIRAILHALETYGLAATEDTYRREFAPKHIGPRRQPPVFAKVIEGKIEFLGMVRGKSNPMYLRFRNQLWNLIPELAREISAKPVGLDLPVPLIITEGKTDWKHLKTALARLQKNGLFQDLDVNFLELGDDSPMGDAELLKTCESYSRIPQSKPIICVFDRDNPKIIGTVSQSDREYKAWGNNVFSFAIPVPEHRLDTTEICIELYYQDRDITRRDTNGRRLFLSNEFDQRSGRLLSSPEIVCSDRNKLRRQLSIVDSQVWSINNDNIALPKDAFVDLIANDEEHFRDINFIAFGRIFELIATIIRSAV
jgi:RNA-directed DNA polymerase